MSPKLLVIFLVLVLAPLGLLGWLGVRVAREERTAVVEQVEQLVLANLEDTRTRIEGILEERQRKLLQLTDLPVFDPDELRSIVRRSGLVRQVFVLGADCGRNHPPPTGDLTSQERVYLERVATIWPDVVAICRAEGSSTQGRRSERGAVEPVAPRAEGQGWYVWQWGGGGSDVVFWWRPEKGGLVGVELDTIRLLSDIVGELPDTDEGEAEPKASQQGLTRLVDGAGKVLYQWGSYTPPKGEAPVAALALARPLQTWKVQRFVPVAQVEAALGGSVAFGLFTLLGFTGLALLGLAFYFYRQQTRAMREATRRVSFANRVSHELRTPLTNLRMYAELLERDLPDPDDRSSRHLEVIVSESRRLSRLVSNVLSFSRHQRGELKVRPGPNRVDDVIRLVLEHFQASLVREGVEVVFEAGADGDVMLDADALEQILGNLVSNVEKYAASGGRLHIVSRLDGGRTWIRVSDRGPGLPNGKDERLFEAFFRPSDSLSEGATGTGLGLGIARDLARLHGGDLRIVEAERGACFEVELQTPGVDGGGS